MCDKLRVVGYLNAKYVCKYTPFVYQISSWINKVLCTYNWLIWIGRMRDIFVVFTIQVHKHTHIHIYIKCIYISVYVCACVCRMWAIKWFAGEAYIRAVTGSVYEWALNSLFLRQLCCVHHMVHSQYAPLYQVDHFLPIRDVKSPLWWWKRFVEYEVFYRSKIETKWSIIWSTSKAVTSMKWFEFWFVFHSSL